MANRTRIREMWCCVGDDGSGKGEGVLSIMLSIPPEIVRNAPQLAGQATYVMMVAYDEESAKAMVARARHTGKEFRVLHFELPQDVTAHF